jgi:hypothetical protein
MMPRRMLVALHSFKILECTYGHARSVKAQACIDGNGDPIPWYTYPAIEYLKQLQLSDRLVFEYGCGNSSLFWQRVAKRVVAVEDNREWYALIEPKLGANAKVTLAPDKESYVRTIVESDSAFDIVVVDGSYRLACARAAVAKLKAGGLIILDNSDWCSKTAEYLRSQGLLEVDMTGFGPINPYIWVTSFFFDRTFSFARSAAFSPTTPAGGLCQQSDDA